MAIYSPSDALYSKHQRFSGEMMARKRRVYRESERKFAILCSNAGIFCQNVTEDETGWDCLVEFPPEGHIGPAESQLGGKRAYVQIKSRVQPKAQTTITLSNARKMVQDPAPWFIILFHEPPNGSPEIYAKHIWGDLITGCLKLIRQADVDGQKLHHKKMTIAFGKGDKHTDDLCTWMEQTIDQFGKEYSEQKRNFFEQSGYEDGYGTATFTVRAASCDEIADAFLGVGDGIEVADWKFVRQRFGISAPCPELEMPTGKLTITPLDHGKCVVRLRHPNSGEVISLDGTCAHNGLAAFDPKLAKAQLDAGFLKVTFSMDTNYSLSVKPDLQKAHSLSYWRDYAKTLIWLREGGVSLELWFEDKRVFESQVCGTKDKDDTWFVSFKEFAEELKQLSGMDYEFYLNDLVGAFPKTKVLLAASFAPKMAFQYRISDILPDEFDQCLYYGAAKVADRVFCSLVARPVVENRAEGQDMRRLILGPARLLDNYATADPPERQRELLRARFEKLIDTIGDRVLGLGDIENVRPDRDLVVTVGGRLFGKI